MGVVSESTLLGTDFSSSLPTLTCLLAAHIFLKLLENVYNCLLLSVSVGTNEVGRRLHMHVDADVRMNDLM